MVVILCFVIVNFKIKKRGEQNMKKSKKLVVGMLVVATLSSSSLAMYCAQSNREAWNNAAATQQTGTELESGETVYPNVYADEEKWAEWKNNWENVRNDFEKVALTPGKNATQLNFAWYSKTKETPKVRFVDDKGEEIKVFTGKQESDTMVVSENAVEIALYPNTVTAYGLEENTTYNYQYFINGEWSKTYTYKTQSTEKFSVLYVGDPQIGASTGQEATEENEFTNKKEYYARNDAYNWNETLQNALEANPDVSFMLSAGDQINQTNASNESDKLQQQVEYAGFLYPSALRSLPIATTIGNHDSKSVNYKNHFNNPNEYIEEVGASTAGNDYYFTYGEALFVVINTNNYNCQTHKELIEKAISENKDAKWKLLMFHQDIYGSGYDHSDSDGMILRTQLTSIIDEAGFDAVLQGHDHTYSRTYQISASEGTYTAYDKSVDTSSEEFQKDSAECYDILTKEDSINKVVDPEGSVYFEANSSTGSKFYQLIGTQQDYIAARSQSWRPTYSVIEFDEVSMTVRTYDAATNEELVADGDVATAYTIVKEADKEALTEIITEAKAEQEKTDVYTEESLDNLTKVIAAAEEIADNEMAISVDIASAYTSVKEAIDSLEEVEEITPGVATLLGDLNNDGKVNLNDAKILLKMALGIKVDLVEEVTNAAVVTTETVEAVEE